MLPSGSMITRTVTKAGAKRALLTDNWGLAGEGTYAGASADAVEPTAKGNVQYAVREP